MSHWWKYPLTDVLPFSWQTFLRFLDSYGYAIWPLQLLSILAAILVIGLMSRPAHRALAIILILIGLSWLVVAWQYFHQSFVMLFWAAPFFAIGFAIQGLLLIALGVCSGRLMLSFANPPRRTIAAGVFGLIALVYPIASQVLLGVGKPVGELFGLFPDATALGTLAAMAGIRGALKWLAIAIPLLWCVVASAISATLGAPTAFVVPLLSGLAIVALFLPDELVMSSRTK